MLLRPAVQGSSSAKYMHWHVAAMTLGNIIVHGGLSRERNNAHRGRDNGRPTTPLPDLPPLDIRSSTSASLSAPTHGARCSAATSSASCRLPGRSAEAPRGQRGPLDLGHPRHPLGFQSAVRERDEKRWGRPGHSISGPADRQRLLRPEAERAFLRAAPLHCSRWHCCCLGASIGQLHGCLVALGQEVQGPAGPHCHQGVKPCPGRALPTLRFQGHDVRAKRQVQWPCACCGIESCRWAFGRYAWKEEVHRARRTTLQYP
mmetsp:Transcript_35554/g.98408  ORF Transcript_35554/g.98408 Transcript_35554/m.98408 type:complete len:260 (+) Transcript_35554:133-912(+)